MFVGVLSSGMKGGEPPVLRRISIRLGSVSLMTKTPTCNRCSVSGMICPQRTEYLDSPACNTHQHYPAGLERWTNLHPGIGLIVATAIHLDCLEGTAYGVRPELLEKGLSRTESAMGKSKDDG